MILISAMTSRQVIGSGNRLPWSIPNEYRMFQAHVHGQVVLFGRKSYEIFGPDLPDSELCVISRTVRNLPGAQVFPDVESAARYGRSTGKTVFSAGGAAIYRETLAMADAMYLSIIKCEYAGDVYFPEFDESAWHVTRQEDYPEFEFRVYEKRVRPLAALPEK